MSLSIFEFDVWMVALAIDNRVVVAPSVGSLIGRRTSEH